MYGPTSEDPVTTEAALRPAEVYGATKAGADILVSVLGRQLATPPVSLRLSNVYGPGRRTDCAIAAMALEAIAGRPVRLAWGRNFSRPYVFIDDVVSAIVQAIAVAPSGRHAYNIAGPDYPRMEDVAQALRDSIPGAVIELEGDGPPPGSYLRHRLDMAPAVRDLGYLPQVGIAAGVARYVGWLRDGS